MQTKHCIFGSLFLLALASAGASPVFSATMALQEPVAKSRDANKKIIPEDTMSWQRDPIKAITGTTPLTSNVSKSSGAINPTPDIVLQGIMKCNKRFYAIINGRTVKSGNIIDGWSVSGISRYRVTLRRAKEQQIYDIYQGKIDRGNR
jgi:hypothetical protein